MFLNILFFLLLTYTYVSLFDNIIFNFFSKKMGGHHVEKNHGYIISKIIIIFN